MKANYTMPKVCPENKDMTKPWFVYFRWTDPMTGERIPFRYKAGLNSIKTKRERTEEANALCYLITERLKTGWNPNIKRIIFDDQRSLLELLYELLELKRGMKRGTVKSYESKLRSFKSWCQNNGLENILPKDFTRILAQSYLDSLIKNSLSGKSHNNHMSIMHAFFNLLVDREIIDKNPFRKIAELPEDIGKNCPYTKDEKKRIRDYLFRYNKRIYYATQFIYYCCIRRTELMNLKAGDIDWANKTITIQSASSKNRRQQSVTINKEFEKILYEMGLDLAPKDLYIFGCHFKTCNRKIVKPDSFTSSHKIALNDLRISNDKGFYSWKHTGICDLYNATKDPYLIMQHCRHSSINITMIYLRSLGLVVNEKIRDAVY